MNARERLRDAKRIVVKVGTSTLAHETGKLDLHRIDHLIRELPHWLAIVLYSIAVVIFIAGMIISRRAK